MTATGDKTIYGERDVEPVPSQQVDPWLYRLVVGILGGAILGTILLVGILSYAGKPGSDLIVGIASAAVGGLIGMLVPSPVRK